MQLTTYKLTKRNNKYVENNNGKNYFQFEQKHYKQTEGLATAVATSAIVAEAYLQHMEHKQLYPNI
jgi:hypothetical protein